MNLLKNEIVERISKIIELKDMTIVRYRNDFFKGKYLYRIYLKNGKWFSYCTYKGLLTGINTIRTYY